MDKMIDPADLQVFLNKIEGGAVAVDLLKIGQKYHQENAPSGSKNSKYNGNFRVALDIEDCLDRFYGGYYSDWACGGQWNRAYQFVQLLANAFKNAHVEVIVFFDGTMKKNKKLEKDRNDFRQKTISVLKHIRMMGTPPPKIWWLPPSGINTTLRNALRSVNIQVAQTVNDHSMEIIEYFHEQKLDAILGLHPDYIIANTIRYFSSHDLRLSYKGALETKEFVVSKLLSSLKLTADHLPFVAVFLGGYTLIDDVKLKSIHDCLKIDFGLDFEATIRKIAEIVRNSPTTDIDEFIKQLNLIEFENEIKESVEYYQRRGKFAGKKYLGQKKRQTGNISGGVNNIHKPIVESTPFASETNENDEIARKMLNEVSNLVDDETVITISSNTSNGNTNGTKPKTECKEKSINTFIYTLPGEVLKTSLTRHQRGIMDARIYQLLTRKEIILPQILEDEQYREIPSIHLFYRPARQMIYAILFNMYHQKYLCSKRNVMPANKDGQRSEKKEITYMQKPTEIQVAEWIWSPQNEYKKPESVTAIPLPWAVPTIQRLWFGMAFEDKQRRMKAFLTVMRSDSTLMLNRGYVPQHMLVLACVLRYIVTNPDRNILTRQELDAFLATAFSPQLPMIEFTQELVLPGVHLRGIYLATLFMQGVETASLANDACGVPLPWTMINPWLFFDGKLFHLKLKTSTCVTTLRELCGNHIEIVLKIERFRKAILEDVEHFLLPAAQMDPMYRPGFLPQPGLPLPNYNQKSTGAAGILQPLEAVAAAYPKGALFYEPPYSVHQALFNLRDTVTGVNPPLISGRNNNHSNNNNISNNRNNLNPRQTNRKGYQLKVGGIVTGQWAATNGNPAAAAAAVAAANRTIFSQNGGGGGGNRFAASNIVGRLGNNLHHRNAFNGKNLNSINIRMPRNANPNNLTGRGIVRSYGNKLNQSSRNRNRNKRKDNRNKINNNNLTKNQLDDENIEKNADGGDNENENCENVKTDENSTEIKTDNDDNDNGSEQQTQIFEIGLSSAVIDVPNGTNALVSDLANSMCDVILKDEEEDALKNDTFSVSTASTVSTPKKILQNSDNNHNKTTTTPGYYVLNEPYEIVYNNDNNNNSNATTTCGGGGDNNLNIDVNTKSIYNKLSTDDNDDDDIDDSSNDCYKNVKILNTKKLKGKKMNSCSVTSSSSDTSPTIKSKTITTTTTTDLDCDELGQGDVSVKG